MWSPPDIEGIETKDDGQFWRLPANITSSDGELLETALALSVFIGQWYPSEPGFANSPKIWRVWRDFLKSGEGGNTYLFCLIAEARQKQDIGIENRFWHKYVSDKRSHEMLLQHALDKCQLVLDGSIKTEIPA